MSEADEQGLTTEFQNFPTSSNGSEPGGTPERYQKKTLQNRESIHEIVNPDDDDASTIDENYDIASLTSSIEDQLTWRGRMQVTVHSIPFQVFILSLVVLDALIVLFELLLDVGAFGNRECTGTNYREQSNFCHYDLDARHRCPPSPIILNENENITEGDGEHFCVCAFRKGKYVCDPDGLHDHGIDPALVLHIFSIIILTTFLFEVLLKLIAFRLKYFTHKFEVFDGFVVVISWILDIASIVREEAFVQLGALIIILRLWRVVRIVNGAVLSAKAQADEQLHQARHKVKEVVHALHKAQDIAAVQGDDLNDYTKLLEQHSIPVPRRRQVTDLPSTIPVYPYDKEEGIKFK